MHHGEYIVFVENVINDPAILSRLSSVSFEEHTTEMKKWGERTNEHIKRFHFIGEKTIFLLNL
jgi:hypothetical protein